MARNGFDLMGRFFEIRNTIKELNHYQLYAENHANPIYFPKRGKRKGKK